jgi:TonB family protein
MPVYSIGARAAGVLLALTVCANAPAQETLVPPPASPGSTAPELPPEIAEPKGSTVVASATCELWLWVRQSGAIQAVQVSRSSGASRLDEACALGVINQTMKPGTVNGQAVAMWAPFRIKWNFGGPPKVPPPILENGAAAIPKLADQVLNVDPPYYPESALKARKQGICEMHVRVSASGGVEKLEMKRSTGVKELDTACLDAIYAAQFTPAQRAGQNVEAAADVWLAWRLPK